LEDYKGGRNFNSLKKFAEESLKPMCSPANIDLYDNDKKAKIEKFSSMSDEDLTVAIASKEHLMADMEEAFKTGVSDLQDAYQKLQTAKEETLEMIKNSGLGLTKAVLASKGTKGNDEL
jgi:hypothetical protein